jgi:hypothetical protein
MATSRIAACSRAPCRPSSVCLWRRYWVARPPAPLMPGRTCRTVETRPTWRSGRTAGVQDAWPEASTCRRSAGRSGASVLHAARARRRCDCRAGARRAGSTAHAPGSGCHARCGVATRQVAAIGTSPGHASRFAIGRVTRTTIGQAGARTSSPSRPLRVSARWRPDVRRRVAAIGRRTLGLSRREESGAEVRQVLSLELTLGGRRGSTGRKAGASGLPRKPLCPQGYRGLESLPLRLRARESRLKSGTPCRRSARRPGRRRLTFG